MSTIAPNGQIRLLSGVPLDNSYENTLYFDSKEAQATYFLSLTPVHTMVNCSRVRDGVIAVNKLADDILHCNYLMFQNQSFSNKWFYAFIEDVEYINNETTYIYYTIDEIQTWLYDGVTLTECLIERQHSTTDGIGDNIVGENIGASELVIGKQLDPQSLCDVTSGGVTYDKLVALYTSSVYDTTDGTFQSAPIGVTDGIINGATVSVWDYNDDGVGTTGVEKRITDLINANQSESIIGGYVIPARLFTPHNSTKYFNNNGSLETDDDGSTQVTNIDFSIGNGFVDIDGYSPKNKKLFTAPYNWIYLLSSDSQFMALQPQFLANRTSVRLKNYHCIVGAPESRLILQNYKGETESAENYFTYTNFPQFGFAIDGYKAWLAAGGEKRLDLQVSQVSRQQELIQNEVTTKRNINRGRNVAEAGLGAYQMYSGIQGGNARTTSRGLKHVVGAVNSEIDNETDAYYQLEKSKQVIQFANENADLDRAIAKTLPSSFHGAISNTSLLASKNLKIVAEQRCVNAQIAETIDNYFTMYGYAQNIVDTPILKARQRFTYIKTVGCKANGGAPTSSIIKIQAIFNSGIRFWVSASDVGNYSTANPVL